MKSFKKFVAEVAQPESEEEKRFKDQHTYEVIKHPVATDAQFTGEVKKDTTRKADQSGDANYDKALKNPEKRMVPESVNEEAEQIDEISKELAGRYIKKAQVDSADAGMDTASQDRDIRKRGINKFLKRRKGVDAAVKRLMKRDEELSPKQKKIDANKNGKIDGHDLAVLRAKKKNEEVEQIDEISMDLAKKAFSKRKGQAFDAAHRGDRKLADKLADKKNKTKAYIDKREEVELDETTSSAMKKMVTQTGPDGKTRTVMKKAKMDRTDDRGQDKIDTKESVELEEAVKVKRGPLRLKDGSQIMVSKQDAELLSRMFSDLSANNQRQMEKVMMMDKAGFEEIRGFAREAL